MAKSGTALFPPPASETKTSGQPNNSISPQQEIVSANTAYDTHLNSFNNRKRIIEKHLNSLIPLANPLEYNQPDIQLEAQIHHYSTLKTALTSQIASYEKCKDKIDSIYSNSKKDPEAMRKHSIAINYLNLHLKHQFSIAFEKGTDGPLLNTETVNIDDTILEFIERANKSFIILKNAAAEPIDDSTNVVNMLESQEKEYSEECLSYKNIKDRRKLSNLVNTRYARQIDLCIKSQSSLTNKYSNMKRLVINEDKSQSDTCSILFENYNKSNTSYMNYIKEEHREIQSKYKNDSADYCNAMHRLNRKLADYNFMLNDFDRYEFRKQAFLDSNSQSRGWIIASALVNTLILLVGVIYLGAAIYGLYHLAGVMMAGFSITGATNAINVFINEAILSSPMRFGTSGTLVAAMGCALSRVGLFGLIENINSYKPVVIHNQTVDKLAVDTGALRSLGPSDR